MSVTFSHRCHHNVTKRPYFERNFGGQSSSPSKVWFISEFVRVIGQIFEIKLPFAMFCHPSRFHLPFAGVLPGWQMSAWQFGSVLPTTLRTCLWIIQIREANEELMNHFWHNLADSWLEKASSLRKLTTWWAPWLWSIHNVKAFVSTQRHVWTRPWWIIFEY